MSSFVPLYVNGLGSGGIRTVCALEIRAKPTKLGLVPRSVKQAAPSSWLGCYSRYTASGTMDTICSDIRSQCCKQYSHGLRGERDRRRKTAPANTGESRAMHQVHGNLITNSAAVALAASICKSLCFVRPSPNCVAHGRHTRRRCSASLLRLNRIWCQAPGIQHGTIFSWSGPLSPSKMFLVKSQ